MRHLSIPRSCLPWIRSSKRFVSLREIRWHTFTRTHRLCQTARSDVETSSCCLCQRGLKAGKGGTLRSQNILDRVGVDLDMLTRVAQQSQPPQPVKLESHNLA